ncbi:MAG: hypothetical protein ACP5T4_02480 [Candidatus Micrarchaeia archaeon]
MFPLYPEAFARCLHSLIRKRGDGEIVIVELGARGVYFENQVLKELKNLIMRTTQTIPTE